MININNDNIYKNGGYSTSYSLNLFDRFTAHQDSSDIRIDIYKAFLKRSKLFGNKSDIINEEFLIETHNYRYAHNSIVDISFWFGIFIGLSYAIVYLMSVFYGIKIFINRKNSSAERLLSICIIASYSIISMVDIITALYMIPISLMYYLLSFESSYID